MHFWIDKRATFGGRSNFGLGHNRSMAGMGYQHRRMRSKSLVTPIRQFPPPSVPSTSHHPKSYHVQHQHRQRHVAPETAPALNAISLNSHHVPVVHSVYPELAVNHTDSTDGITNETPLRRCFFVYLKCVLCITILMVFLTVKLYEDNNQIGLIWLLTTFGSICLVLFLLCFTKRRAPLATNQPSRVGLESNTRVPHNHELIIHDESPEPPPPYAVAVKLNEKAFITKESPPPSYDKINSI